MSKTGMSLDELQAARKRANDALFYAYLESIRNDVPALLELAAAIEKERAAAIERLHIAQEAPETDSGRQWWERKP